MLITVLTLLLAVPPAAAQADATGTWDGTLKGSRSDGTTHEDTVLLILQQKDTAVTGSVGGHESDQHRITSGTADGNRLVLVAVTEGGREFRIEVTIEGDEMTGVVTTGDRRADLQVRRRKE